MELLKDFFPKITATQMEQFAQLPELYADWNSKINVISRKDIENIRINHILHSLAIAKIVKFRAGSQVLDVGTGGGFPGIPLAILFPGVQFTLIDSIAKKIKVVDSIAKQLELKNVQAIQIRSNELKGNYDFIVSRAVSALPKFINDTRHLIARQDKNAIPNGILYLKGGDIAAEISPYKKYIEVYDIQKYFQLEFFNEKKIVYLSL